MTIKTLFLLGIIGALAPEIVRLYSIRNNPNEFKWSWFYLVISVLFACLGGLLAVILPTSTYWGAFYVGVSTPVLINKILEKGMEISRPNFKQAAPPIFRKSAPQSSDKSLLHSFVQGL